MVGTQNPFKGGYKIRSKQIILLLILDIISNVIPNVYIIVSRDIYHSLGIHNIKQI